MNIMSVFALGTGISVFMLGMMLIKYSLGENFSKKSEELLKKFTSGRFSAAAVGTLATAVLQSSSASSVITATLVDNGALSLYGAFWIIVGANLGTTFTGLLTAVSFSEFAPAACILGIALISLTKKKALYGAGVFLTGFGLLFVGMDIMENAAGDIKNSPVIYDILQKSSSPLTGILTGSLFTAVIQSSAAVTALLQTMAYDGIIGIRQAFYIILGSNIGTCATCFIASMGLGGGAKKVALMHIFYNFAGSLLFVFLAFFVPLPEITGSLFTGNIKMQIGFINVVFNGVCALAALILPIKEKNKEKQHLHFVSPVVKYSR